MRNNLESPIQPKVFHHIVTTGPPCFARPRRLAPDKLRVAKDEFEYMLQMGICRPSSSPWASPLHLARKKTGDWRPCGDYRRLNSQTVADRYPLPNIQDCTLALHGSSVFSKLDLERAFMHLPVHPEDVPKTAVTTPFGMFEFMKMPFGLRNASQTFQRFVDSIVRDLPFIYTYIDDWLLFSKSRAEHLRHLDIVLQRLHDHGLSINVEKCQFLQDSIDFLGYTISSKGISPMKDKVSAIESYPRPKTVAELKRFLGMINFYHRFCPHLADIQSSLHISSTKNDQRPVEWNSDMLEAFEKCKQTLSADTLLVFPDPDATLSIMCDASQTAIGGAIHQTKNDRLYPLAFFSRKLRPAELNYSTYDRELLSIHETIRHFSYILEGRTFSIYTDHRPLIYAFTKSSERMSPRQIRHLSYISQFSTDIRHVKGLENTPADALSRVDTILKSPILPTDIASAQNSDEELANLLSSNSTSLRLQRLRLDSCTLICDTSRGIIRPFVPTPLRAVIFRHFHGISHPGARATARLISERFVWPSMQKDIKHWSRHCHHCQSSKIHRHEKSPLVPFLKPNARFACIHIDVVGPLPNSNGFVYLLTCIDRFTKWIEALPMTDQMAATVATTFFNGWVSRFGTPITVVADRGRNFESSLFHQVSSLLGIEIRHTTSYHPQCNGLVERSHRSIKAALMSRLEDSRSDWYYELPIVLLGLRSVVKPDIGATPSELVYGTTLRLPGELLEKSTQNVNAPTIDYVVKLRSLFDRVRPADTNWHSSQKVFSNPALHSASHVYLRFDGVRHSLQRPYTGPYRVLRRTPKTFDILINNKRSTVSRDRLKPAFVLPDQMDQASSPTPSLPNRSPSPTPNPEPTPLPDTPALPRSTTTRSGRRVRFPSALSDFTI
ncbi:unnamed protein product [Nesidiocoris tenuis]|uniref:RNA-directed DNA polymerase n=1 Tax=Nesidiocoris tenuis TaxID=355587 RepID=A0A6H5HDH6_9HEMI|nr:unnamed protein product [Nesidiocoris tenuis]